MIPTEWVSAGFEAQFGASTGGTSYLIPANIEGDQREAAVTFLQFVSAPEHIEPWLQATGGIPALNDAGRPRGCRIRRGCLG